MDITVTVIEITAEFVVVEYSDHEGLQRRYLPNVLLPEARRNKQFIIANELLALGIEYSDISLSDILGEVFPAIPVRVLEQALRKEGLWKRSDYIQQAGVIKSVVTRLRDLDVVRIINAARQPVDDQ